MHPEHYTDLDNFDTVQSNLRNSAKESNDAYDVTDSLTDEEEPPVAQSGLSPDLSGWKVGRISCKGTAESSNCSSCVSERLLCPGIPTSPWFTASY